MDILGLNSPGGREPGGTQPTPPSTTLMSTEIVTSHLPSGPVVIYVLPTSKTTTWRLRLTTWAFWVQSSCNVLQSLIGEYWTSLSAFMLNDTIQGY